MRKIFVCFFIILFTSNAFALYTSNIPNACGIVHNHLIARFQINSYTCDVGYFLPADTEGCVPCPTDHVCSGGTFEFNPTQSQGITYKRLTRTATNSCASNIAHQMVAVFQPNTITLNYDNGDGTQSNGTCTYDAGIILPETPSRQGYTFQGWKLQEDNE